MGGAFSYLRTALPLVRARMRDEHYDIVHVFFSLPTGAMLPFLSLGDTPVIVSLRGSDVPGYDPYQRTLGRAHQVLRPLTRWIWRRANRVVAVCESLGRLALRTDPGLRYSVIPNGVDLTRFRPSARAAIPPSEKGALHRGRPAGGAQGNRRPDPGDRLARAGPLRAGDRGLGPRRAPAQGPGAAAGREPGGDLRRLGGPRRDPRPLP